jgi:cysteinyl-tRNA synthetase
VLLFFLTGHWRKPIDFTDETLAQAKAQLATFQNALLEQSSETSPPEEWGRLEEILDDDFNTPEALALMHDWRRRGRYGELRRALALFGLATETEPETAPAAVVDLAEQRQAARAAKDFAEADRVRDAILALGWEVRDDPDGGYRLVRR